MEEEEVSGDTL
ncbi:mannosyl-oligosaccharide 1,2-alpha-mannosidase IB, putative, partial [Trypanosoma cruzi]